MLGKRGCASMGLLLLAMFVAEWWLSMKLQPAGAA